MDDGGNYAQAYYFAECTLDGLYSSCPNRKEGTRDAQLPRCSGSDSERQTVT